MRDQRPYAPATPFERPKGALEPTTPLRPCPIYKDREQGRGFRREVSLSTPIFE